MIRQPIVSVLGHVDHGKTTLLDAIRGTAVAAREAGAITQHIGATEVPLDTILKVCGDLVAGRSFKVPGLLFIDTPGHEAFTTLRARGGSLADLAVLVVDLNEGLRPQTIEAIRILQRFRTGFVVAANKIDLIPGWRREPGRSFQKGFPEQAEATQAALNERVYNLAGKLAQHSLSADLYTQVADFEHNVAIVPVSAKFGEGVPDLLLMLIGLAQRYLERRLESEEGPAEGTVLEVKEEKGLGLAVDAIIYHGSVRKGDTLVVGTIGEPRVVKVRALLKPKALDEIRDPEHRFESVDRVTAAAGVKVLAADLEGVVAGAPLRVAAGNVDEIVAAVHAESQPQVETQDTGVVIKADAIGSLEALAYEMRRAGITIRMARLGPVSKHDIVDAATIPEALHRVVLAFNVPVLPEAREEMARSGLDVLAGDIIYRLVEDYGKWAQAKGRELEEARRKLVIHPAKVLLLPDHTFRVSKPAIVGVRVLAGRLRPGLSLMRRDGHSLGRIKSVQSEGKTIPEAMQGAEVAIALEGVTVGRQLNEGDTLYVDLPAEHARRLFQEPLSADDRACLEEIAAIKRAGEPFWGM